MLPFENLSGDPDQDYFADGIVEEITTAIARCPGLFVIARNSSYAYRDKGVDVKQMARTCMGILVSSRFLPAGLFS